MFRPMRSVGLLCIALVYLGLPVTSGWAATPHRVLMPMISTPIPSDFVYAVTDSTDYDLYTASLNGSRHPLTNTPDVHEVSPTWSPDRNQIAYVAADTTTHRTGDAIEVLWLTNPTMPKRILKLDGYAGGLEWSPTGNRFVFIVRWLTGLASIYSMNVDGTDLKQLTEPSNCIGWPTWSADGTKIAFAGNENCKLSPTFHWPQPAEIFVMNADGSGVTQLTPTGSHEYVESLTWSPDGTRIAYDTSRYIYTVRPDGTHQQRLTTVTNYNDNEGFPSWSPDGHYVTFTRTYYKSVGRIVLEVATGKEGMLNLPNGLLVWAR